MDRTQIMLPLPVVRFDVSAGYVRLVQASGLDYLLLRMVEYGKITGNKLRIGDLMGLLSIAEDMIPLVLKNLDSLRERGLISHSLDRINKDTTVGKIELTEAGNSMCQNGYAVGESGRLEEKMMFFPARSEPFAKDDGFESVRDRPTENRLDGALVSDFVLGNRPFFGLDDDVQIVSRIRVGNERTGIYRQPTVIEYDENDAVFAVSPATGLVPGKLRELGIKAEDILSELPADFTDVDASVPVTVEWQDAVPDIRCGHVLPRNFKLGDGLVVCNESVVKADVPLSAKMPDGFGYHLAHIQGRKKGKRYWFVRYTVRVKDLDGGYPLNMVLRQKMGDSDIDELLTAVGKDCGEAVEKWIGETRLPQPAESRRSDSGSV